MLARKIKNLPLAEKILLVEELWDDIAAYNKRIRPDQDEIAFVKQRLSDIKKSPDSVLTWGEIKAKARKIIK
ncbi:MAG: addiction module protein [Proteobacteria bacterium]|nr:addiction module protein [Pseudomonadota bacterium]